MNKRGTATIFVDPLKVDEKLVWIMFSIGDNFGAEESDDVISDDIDRFVLKVAIVDPKMVIEPSNFNVNEVRGDESLKWRE